MTVITSLRPYPKMKDSGLRWLGNIPDHWDVKRGKSLFRCIDVRSPTGEEELLTVSSERGVVPRSSAKVTMFKAESYVGYKLCWPGDLVINSLWAWGRGLGVSRHHGIVSSAYGVYRLRHPYTEYFSYIHELVRSTPFNWELQVRSKGIWISRLQLTDESFLGAPFPVPPVDEQAAIVRFLEYADQRIRRYIRTKQKLIKLLEEQKQAIIHQAVTRGLDPSVQMSQTTEFLLNQLPKHWPLLRAKYLFKQVTPLIPENAEIVTCFRDGNVTLRRNRRTTGFTIAIKELGYQGILPGQLVLHSMDAFAGAIGISDSSGKCSPEYVICEPVTSDILPQYYAYLLRALALRGLFVVLCPSVRERAPRVRFSDFNAFTLPKPPIEEQEKIVDHIHTACIEADTLLEKTRREIQLLIEFRNRIVADVVTGKLDVRDAATRLPNDPTDNDVLKELDAISDEEPSEDSELEEA